ncbi:ABC transporter permease subunit [Microbacterium sp. cx-55]|uniref:ABC transporter permease subunit n=1 Tax=unclassified Microbacterium TaxID=2609290 RepID=UPI001CBABA70|nr:MULTISPECIES: ABC transporter permease subunit [unclassified Microbacterium]MBZ4485777.1 ABC transporter permease subunit [Microbacterium sp. cx-55]MCC4906740.1 ABC transporter permease subunit [Microbacterium sp. cx-59]UGB34339.1 ABC transporter permease subunit [Microbacterium sp. cx-55]
MTVQQVIEQDTPPTDPRRESHARAWRAHGVGFVVKVILMGVVNALGIMAIISALSVQSWLLVGVTTILLIAADIVYFTRRALPLKYLMPGLVFLLVFQVFVFGYTAYIAFTNYGTGHAGSVEQAVDAALVQGERRVEGSATYPLTVVERFGEYGFAINDGGDVRVGTETQPLQDAGSASGAEAPASVDGWTVVPRAQLLTDQEVQAAIEALRVPVSDDPNDGSIRTRDGSSGLVYTPTMLWDADARTITDTVSGTVYTADDTTGSFVAADGTRLPAGWYVNVGFDNFLRVFTDASLAGPLLSVTVWTFAFAIGSVVISFGIGLVFAIVFNDPRVRARKYLRTLIILPYAFPAFMSALLFRGMFNAEFGVINDLFFFGSQINWLGDPWLAKAAVLWINVWLSFPYWFLVCTGALQALPKDTLEAAEIDGAGKWRQFRAIILPLLLVSTAPLAISSFAFSFNNFTVIYMFNAGGPPIPGAPYSLGSTDILISAIYRVSGVAGGAADYGLASALSIIVFIVVGIISAIAFRQTRKLEEYQ